MAGARAERPWRLKSFLDSLTLELDRVQDTLAVKGVNRRLTYAVRDLSLELQLFPEFDGEELRFTTARPGDAGAARINFQLGSITDRQIRETTSEPATTADVSIEGVEGLDPKVKRSLEKIGVTSMKDLERVERHGIDLGKVSEAPLDYRNLAEMIRKSRRRARPPLVREASLARHEGEPVVQIEGENLAAPNAGPGFPRAFLDGEEVPVRAASASFLRIRIDPAALAARPAPHALQIALDPYAVLRMNLRP